VLDVSAKPERPEQAPAGGQKVTDAAGDQDTHQVIVKRPARVVARRHRKVDETYGVVDDRDHDGQRPPAPVACDCHRRSWPRELRADVGAHLPLGLRLRVAVTTQQLRSVVSSTARVTHLLAVDACCRGSSEVGPQRLATAAAQVFPMVLREDEDAAAEPISGNPEQPLIEVCVECLSRPRSRKNDILPSDSHDEGDQRSDAPRPGHSRRDGTGSRETTADRERTNGRNPWARVANLGRRLARQYPDLGAHIREHSRTLHCPCSLDST
jgi:hypothetical protein